MLHIFWFRKDLRLIDNRALSEFIKSVSKGKKFAFLYIKNKNSFSYFGEKRIGFLIECLDELKKDLHELSLELQLVEGTSLEVFEKITEKFKQISLYVNEQVEPYCTGRDAKIQQLIESNGGIYNSFNDSTIFRLGEVTNGNGRQYVVYTPFKNQALKILKEEHYKKMDCDFSLISKRNETIFKDLKCYDTHSQYKKLSKSDFLKGGRNESIKLLKDFYDNRIEKYKSNRNNPSLNGTSLLSAHLHFGTVGIRETLRTALSKLSKVKNEIKQTEVQTWINELLWREFYYQITFHYPHVIFESFKKEYDSLEWNYDENVFQKWCNGMTGYPIVDAGMRQLNKEGWLHNRVRMIVAMFLTKDLFIDWRLGEKYFAEKLIDMDFANNNGGWQWSASTGVDSQPYFRIFNPYLQSKKFDAEGNYIKKYVTELRNVPKQFIHEPNLMSELEQDLYKTVIGKNYPAPIVNHSEARGIAIERFKEVLEKNNNGKHLFKI